MKRCTTLPGCGVRLFVAIAIGLGLAQPAVAQQAVARDFIEVAVEQVFKNAAGDVAEQLAAMGGKTAVRELLEKAGQEGGEALVQKVTPMVIEQGPIALRVIARAPAKMVEALEGLAPALRGAALRAVEREPELMTPLVTRYGTDALAVAVHHPGVGAPLAEQLGRPGIEAAGNLTTDQAILLRRHATEIKALPAADQASVLAKIAASPDRVLTYLEEHTGVLKTAAGVAVVLALKAELLGDNGKIVTGLDGKPTRLPPTPGFLERMVAAMVRPLVRPLNLLATILAIGLGGWLIIRLWGTWRRQSLRTVAATIATDDDAGIEQKGKASSRSP